MKTTKIYKYSLALIDEQFIRAPRKLIPLAVNYQNEDLCLWAELDPEEEERRYLVTIVGTGQPINKKRGVYIGTVVMPPSGRFVWHVFIRLLEELD